MPFLDYLNINRLIDGFACGCLFGNIIASAGIEDGFGDLLNRLNAAFSSASFACFSALQS
ncbi:MAG: hypothetical protein U1E36_02385 [Rickettsiales bacterium]